MELLHKPQKKMPSEHLSFPLLYWEYQLCSDSGVATLPALPRLGKRHKPLFEEPKRIWIPTQDAFGTDGQKTNRFHATWNHRKETIAGGKENDQNQGHILVFPVSALTRNFQRFGEQNTLMFSCSSPWMQLLK